MNHTAPATAAARWVDIDPKIRRFATDPAEFFGHSRHAMHHVEPTRWPRYNSARRRCASPNSAIAFPC